MDITNSFLDIILEYLTVSLVVENQGTSESPSAKMCKIRDLWIDGKEEIMEFWPLDCIERKSPSSAECQQRLEMPRPIIGPSEEQFSR